MRTRISTAKLAGVERDNKVIGSIGFTTSAKPDVVESGPGARVTQTKVASFCFITLAIRKGVVAACRRPVVCGRREQGERRGEEGDGKEGCITHCDGCQFTTEQRMSE